MIQTSSYDGVLAFRLARSFLGRGYYFTAAYLVDGLLVDTGCAHTAAEFQRALGDRVVRLIVNTHRHEDHIGANGALQRTLGVQVQAHEDALPFLDDPRKLRLHPYRRLFWGWPRPSRGTPLGPMVETPQHRFQVVPTPGHTSDHVAFFEPERRWLFSGDAFIGGRERAMLADSDIYAVIDSLKRLLALQARWLFPGSGHPRENPLPILTEKVHYLEDLGERVRSLYQRGVPPRAIRRQVLGPNLPIAYVTLGHFSGAQLVCSYLRPLVDGRVAPQESAMPASPSGEPDPASAHSSK